MPVPAPADKRFRRARVSPARRPAWRRWGRRLVMAVLVLLAGTYGGARLVEVALDAPGMTVTRISVTGNARVPTAGVRALLESADGASLLTLDLDGLQRRLRSLPWVADADIRRVFPGALAVSITEREAAAIGRVDGVPYLIDQDGTIIEEFGPQHADIDVPIVDGLAVARSGELLVDERRARLAGHLLAALRPYPELADRISQIDVTDVRNAVVVLKDDTARVHVGGAEFATRLQSYVEIAGYLRERVPDIDYVDLRYGDRVYVKPHEPAPPAAPRGRKG